MLSGTLIYAKTLAWKLNLPGDAQVISITGVLSVEESMWRNTVCVYTLSKQGGVFISITGVVRTLPCEKGND